MNNKEWFNKAKFGMFIHWGLYSVLGGEWKHERTPGLGEWIQAYSRIPNSEYEKLAQAFNPVFFNADEWVSLAKNAGMEYIVLTAKHHEGFALYRSETDSYNVYDATPFKRDIVKEFAEACKKQGLKLGLYYSQDQDWHEPDGGGYAYPYPNVCGEHWSNDWDFPDNGAKDYSRFFTGKVLPQVEELVTKYAEIALIWFDNPITLTKEQGQALYDLVKKHQPDCLINSRIGNGLGDYRSMGDNEIPDNDFKQELVEAPTTLNDTWGYKSFDQNWKSADEVIKIKKHLNERGVNYLLNVGPDWLGRIPVPAQDILRKVGEAGKLE
ncbi:MAG: alpha-L-fucosidase [Clostridiales bacterium]|jgi:alpha-L-fucosidase|nr:alpha-L-fucosidase [Clostridiales bacterium]